MKFKIKVGPADEAFEPHWEEYDENIDDAQKWAEDIIVFFNNTAQPGAVERILLAVEVLDPDTIKNHDWSKKNLVTLTSPQGFYDHMVCTRCGVIARRYGLCNMVRQNPYRAKKFDRCDTSIEALK